jgi:non-ribosomal peptide synthetase component F
LSETGGQSRSPCCTVLPVKRRIGDGVGCATLPEWFEAQVACTSNALALLSDTTRLSYAELNRRANRLAHWLIGEGAGPERLVGVALPRSPELVVAMLAVLKTGAGCLPLDLAYPRERLDYMVADAKPLLVLDDPAAASGC